MIVLTKGFLSEWDLSFPRVFLERARHQAVVSKKNNKKNTNKQKLFFSVHSLHTCIIFKKKNAFFHSIHFIFSKQKEQKIPFNAFMHLCIRAFMHVFIYFLSILVNKAWPFDYTVKKNISWQKAK